MERALVIIDVQKDYFEGGRNELVNAVGAAENIKKLIKEFRKRKEPIIYIQHINTKPDAAFMVDGTDGIEISELILPQSTDLVIEKHYPNSFLQTSLENNLKDLKIQEIVVCGMMTHMCVDTTVRAAKGLGYGVTLVEDACATRNLIWDNQVITADIVQNVFMASLSGTFAKVCKVKNLI